MTPEAIQSAATILADLRLRANGRTAPLDDLPEQCRPANLDDAYAVQEAVRPLLAAHAPGAVAGWKIGCTTPVMQDYLDISHPCAGTLYQGAVHAGHATLDTSGFFQLGLECELAVRLASDIAGQPDGHRAETVAPAVGGVMTSVEIVDLRFTDFTAVEAPSLVADDFFSAGCVLGPARTLAEMGDLSTLVGGFTIDREPQGESGTGAAILGAPLKALAWLADHAAARGSALKVGEVITLGSVVKTIYPEAGVRIEAGFDRLGPVTLDIR